MRKILLRADQKFYRANLHCHTTVSDGKKTPEQIKEFYKSNGYAAVAFTDHEVFFPHNDLTDDEFIALNGVEYAYSRESWSNRMKTCHVCMIAPNAAVNSDPIYRSHKYKQEKHAQLLARVNNEGKEDFVTDYSADGMTKLMKAGRDAGFFVTYNHPAWSLESYPEYMGYDGMNALEIVNYGCVCCGYDDVNKQVAADMLNGKKKIYLLATDDNHNGAGDDTPYCDSFGGYVMIGAQSLSYENLFNSLESGNFYSVNADRFNKGPEIYSIEYEDGEVFVKCSDARKIALVTGTRACKIRHGEPSRPANEAVFKLVPDEDWFRITVTDYNGFEALSNPYFLEDIR